MQNDLESSAMGQKKQRTQQFLKDHPFCCLCGGTVRAETIEHAPPKILFTESHRPKGLEVPACQRCNNGSSHLDQIAALFTMLCSQALLLDDRDSTVVKKSFDKVLKGVANNSKEVLGYFKQAGEECVLVKGKKTSVSRSHVDEQLFDNFLNSWAAKQVLAFWYHSTGLCASEQVTLFVKWTNQYMITNEQEFLKIIKKFPDFYDLKQGRWETTDQFFVSSHVNKKEKIGVFFFVYHDGTGFYAAIDDASTETKKSTKLSDRQGGTMFKVSAEKGVSPHQSPDY